MDNPNRGKTDGTLASTVRFRPSRKETIGW
jgi:hypothetical protein